MGNGTRSLAVSGTCDPSVNRATGARIGSTTGTLSGRQCGPPDGGDGRGVRCVAREKVVRGGRVAAVALVGWLVGSVLAIGSGGAYADDSVNSLLQPATLHKLETALAHGSTRSESDQLVKASAAVGPLFRDGLDNGHSCTASVVTSASGHVLLTAAHCISGSAVGWAFAPGWLTAGPRPGCGR